MNLAIDVRPLQSGVRTGVGEYAYELLSAVFSLYPEHTYFLCSSGLKPFELPANWHKPNIIPLHLGVPNKMLNASIALFNWPKLSDWPLLLNKQINFDAVYFPNLNFIAPEPKFKTIITVHDVTFKVFPQYFSLHQRLWHKLIKPHQIINKIVHITAPSQSTKNDLQTIFKIPSQKITVVYPGQCSEWSNSLDRQNYVKEKYQLPPEFILCLATIEPRKNISGLVRAFALWQKQGASNVELIIAGAPGWNNKKIFSLINQTPKVRFIGYVPESEKPALYALAKIFAYPSFYEGFGLPVLDALRSGTPVIASNRSALPEVVGKSGYLVDPNRVSDLVNALTLLQDQNIRDQFSKIGLARASEFSWEKSAHEFIKILQ